MINAHDSLLVVHVSAGSIGLVLGLLALLTEGPPDYRSRAGAGYLWAVLIVASTALGLVAFDAGALWWLVPLAVLTSALALAGYRAPRQRGRAWVRIYAHGQGGAYIALVTALLVVSLEGPAATAAWVAPLLVGLPLIERRVATIAHREASTAPTQIVAPRNAGARALRRRAAGRARRPRPGRLPERGRRGLARGGAAGG